MKTNNFKIHTVLLTTAFLVFLTNSIANADIKISVNGDTDPIEGEYNIKSPGDELILDIWSTTTVFYGSGDDWAGFELICSPARATIHGGVSLWPAEPGLAIFDGVAGAGLPAFVPGEDGVWGTITITGTGVGPGTLFDNIIIHRENPLPPTVIVTLWGTMDYQTGTLLDMVVFYGVPEPITIVLLGLGGLFIRRRK